MKHSRIFIDRSGLNRALDENIINDLEFNECINEKLGVVFTQIGNRKSLTRFPNSMPLKTLINFIEEKEKAIKQYKGGA